AGRELVAAAADERRAGVDRDRDLGVEKVAGLAVAAAGIPSPPPDSTGQAQRLGPAPGVDEPALDEQRVETLPGAPCCLRGSRSHPAIMAQPASRRLTPGGPGPPPAPGSPPTGIPSGSRTAGDEPIAASVSRAWSAMPGPSSR